MLVDLGAVPVGRSTVLVVAQDPKPPPGKGEEFGKASPVGLVILVLLFLATIGLIRSMNKHIRRLPASFDESAGPPQDVAATPPAVMRSGDDPPTGPRAADGPARDTG